MRPSEQAPAHAIRRSVVTFGVGLTLVWGVALPSFLLLDPIAAEWARLTGTLAGAVSTAAAYGLTRLRLSRRVVPHFAFRAALDLTVSVSLAAIIAWLVHQIGGRVPYVEAFSILLLQVATGWAAALGLYTVSRANLRTLPGSTGLRGLPGIRTVFVVGAVVLGVIASVSLGIGSSTRAAGALDRQAVAQLETLADLFAAGIDAAPEPSQRRRVLGVAQTLLNTQALLVPVGALPAPLAVGGVEPRWASPNVSDDGHLMRLQDGERSHWVRRVTAHGVLWLTAAANVRPPVRAPDDAPAMMILALLVLGAPIAALVVGQDLRAELRQVTADLQAMAPGAAAGAPAGVPVASNDEVGDLAIALNVVCRRFGDQNAVLAAELDAAAASDRARARFLTAASHELRTPLHTIAGYCHLLGQDAALSPAQREDIQVIAEATVQLQTHVDEILDLGRIEAGDEEPLVLTDVALGALVRRVVERGTTPPGLTVSLDLAPDLPTARLDARRVQQILENLVGNALKFTGTGRVDIRLWAEPLNGAPGLAVDVRDTGPGIPPAELEQVFAEFHRVEGQRSVAGTGLGLPIARRLAERHGGTLWATSTPGEGSCFHLRLPIGGPA